VSSPSARNLLRTPRSGITPARGNDSAKLASTIHAFQPVVAAVQRLTRPTAGSAEIVAAPDFNCSLVCLSSRRQSDEDPANFVSGKSDICTERRSAVTCDGAQANRRVRSRRLPLADLLDPTNKPNNEKDNKNGSEYAAADVHGISPLSDIEYSFKHDSCELSGRDRT
jgi:hypothetical protein